MMESNNGSFGDLLAAFNIDSEDSDVANATYQYDEAACDNKTSSDNADQAASDKPEKTVAKELKNQQTENGSADHIKAIGETQNIKVEPETDGDNITSPGLEPATVNPEIAPVSIGGLLSVPQVATLVPPVPDIASIPMVSQVPGETVLLPNLPPNSITQTLVSQAQLQPLVQSIQSASLLSNPLLLNSSGVIGATSLLSQGIVPDLTQSALINQQLINSSPAVVSLGAGIQNNVIAVPMALLPTVLNQPAAVTPNSDLSSSGIVTPTAIITPSVTPSPSTSPSPVPTIGYSELSKRQLCRKGRASGSAPTVQELLDKRRRNQSPLLSASNLAKPTKYDIMDEMPLTLSGRKRRHTKRYMEYLASKDESEDDQLMPKMKKAALPKLKSPVLDLNKPLTDQLMTISETAAVPSGLQVINVQSLSATSLSPKGDHPIHYIPTSDKLEACIAKRYNSIVIKQEPVEYDDGSDSCSRSSNITEPVDMSGNKSRDEEGEQNIVAPDGTVIKNEPSENTENIQSKKRKHNDDDTNTNSKKPQTNNLDKDAKEEDKEQPSEATQENEEQTYKATDHPVDFSKPIKSNKTKEKDGEQSTEATDKPLDTRKPIRTREEEERIASEAATRAASQALLRMASQPPADTRKDKDTIRKENELRMSRLAEEYQKQQAAQLAMREAAQKTASEAAARAVSLALTRAAIEEELEPKSPDLESLKEAEEAAKIASEAATRAAAEAAKRAVTEAAQKAAEEPPEDTSVPEEKAEEEARRIAAEAAARAAAQAAVRAATEAATQAAEVPVDLSTPKTHVIVNHGIASQEDLSLIAQQAAVRAVLEAQRRTGNYVPILPATSYTKPTHIRQIIHGSAPNDAKDQQGPVNVLRIESIEQRDINKVVTPSKQIITYPKNPSKNLRQSLAWRSFQEGVKQGKYKIVQKSASAPLNLNVKDNGRQKTVNAVTVINHDMRCPYCLTQMKSKSSLIQHISVCLINPQTNDDDYFTSHIASETLKFAKKSPSRLCSHCTPNATSVKELKSWSNVLCRMCVTKCADPKITEKTGDHFIVTKSGYFVCKHCGIGLDSEADMKAHLNPDQVKKDKNTKDEALQDKNSLPVSKILLIKENDPSFQYRCGKCRLMFSSVGHLLVHTSHCNVDQYIKVLERLTLYSCFNCPVACKVVPDDGKSHQCKPKDQYSSTLKKNLQAVRDTSTSKESFVCLRCEDIFPSNGYLVLHTKQCNHAQYHLLMRYLDQPPYCNRCLMVFTGYKAYSQHRQWCMKAQRETTEDCGPLSVCDKCKKSVQREEADMMYHDAVCVGLPCTQQRLLFPDGFNSRECCTVINSW